MRLLPSTLLTVLLIALPLHAGEPKPEIDRPIGTAQADGAAHTLRTIPEACARFEGRFTGDAAKPYDFAAVRTSERCQPRARLLDAAKAKPSTGSGWLLNDLVRVPRAACPGQQAVLQVWRKPAKASGAPRLDAQGRARVYLKDAGGKAMPVDADAMPAYSVRLSIQGKPCG